MAIHLICCKFPPERGIFCFKFPFFHKGELPAVFNQIQKEARMPSASRNVKPAFGHRFFVSTPRGGEPLDEKPPFDSLQTI